MKHTFFITGMHCRSCETILKNALQKEPQMGKVTLSFQDGQCTIDGGACSLEKIEEIIRNNGYTIGKEPSLPWIASAPKTYFFVGISLLIILAFFLLSQSVSFSFIPSFQGVPSVSLSLLVGLAAGFSSCMALIGGLLVGISSEALKQHTNASFWTQYRPHCVFHAGRIAGFALFGGILGMFWSFLSFSPILLGIMTAIIAVYMGIMGLHLSGISPRMEKYMLIPKWFSGSLQTTSVFSKGAFLAGALSFFLPCGFTFLMQTFALSSQNFWIGASIMAAFALGTSFGLLSLVGVVQALGMRWIRIILPFSGVVLLVLAVFHAQQSYHILQASLVPVSQEVSAQTENLPVQDVFIRQNNWGYSPSEISIRPQHRIRVTIESEELGCASSLLIPKLNMQKNLALGKNQFEFISPSSGSIPFTCSMGMYPGKFIIQ